jgi:hypothetical protein
MLATIWTISPRNNHDSWQMFGRFRFAVMIVVGGCFDDFQSSKHPPTTIITAKRRRR